ncbi:phospholipase A2 inhibitor gamma subunit A-like [Hyla sarda]|uniref:phospholipase A2 inhibitor gamma subunit A-like n=1 Tax=Hyla sarda TaxID=327740 RepID=UPI0024C460C0|nr:phospholipase A2 inhibitor gamma subunit A-like [Hyla sarda]
MKPVIISVLLLSFLLSIAAALNCYHCHKRNSDTCEHEEKKCPEGDQCITISEEYKNNGTFRSIFKGCSRDLPCEKEPYGKVNNDVYLLISTKCCDKDLCNSEFYEMPEDDEPNGVICPSCYEENTAEECKGDHEIMCRGKDDKCLTFSGDVKKPDGNMVTYSCKGCISTLACQLELSQMIGVQVLDEKIFTCVDNPPKPPGEEENDKEKINLLP